MQSNDADRFDSLLAAVALVKAYINGDKAGVDAVLAEQSDHTAILSSLLRLMEDVLTKASGGHPHVVLDGLRARIVARIAGDAEGEQ